MGSDHWSDSDATIEVDESTFAEIVEANMTTQHPVEAAEEAERLQAEGLATPALRRSQPVWDLEAIAREQEADEAGQVLAACARARGAQALVGAGFRFGSWPSGGYHMISSTHGPRRRLVLKERAAAEHLRRAASDPHLGTAGSSSPRSRFAAGEASASRASSSPV